MLAYEVPLATITQVAELKRLGFKEVVHPAEWEDDGDSESGPHLNGHDEYSEWSLGDKYVIVVDGEIVDQGTYPPEWPTVTL